MTVEFTKYQGAGNDFILIDNRDKSVSLSTDQIAHMCDRKFGIGADGLILLELSERGDFKMVYFNSDGKPSSMCGNGGRCIVHFAQHLGLIGKSAVFEAIDGMHEASIDGDQIILGMADVKNINRNGDAVVLDTGSPHYVILIDDIEDFDVKKEGAEIRYHPTYRKSGINVNFVKAVRDAYVEVRTYERGVEDETLSCGTGVTAVALAMHHLGQSKTDHIVIRTRGGILEVKFRYRDGIYSDIRLIGPATPVFKGEI